MMPKWPVTLCMLLVAPSTLAATARADEAASTTAETSSTSDANRDSDDIIHFEPRFGLERQIGDTLDRRYWSTGYALRLFVPAPDLAVEDPTCGVRDRSQIGFVGGLELFGFDHEAFEQAYNVRGFWKDADWLWSVDVAFMGRYWIGIWPGFRIGLEGSAGAALTSNAEVRYLERARESDSDQNPPDEERDVRFDHPWGVGPTASAAGVVAFGPMTLSAGARTVVADGVGRTALVVYIGVMRFDRPLR